MSINSLPKINQKEYLKRYLSGDKVKKKSKKDKKHKKSKDKVKVKIIDDDVYDVDNAPKIDEELLLTGDDAPQIVGECVEQLQDASSNVPRWKSIAVKEEQEDDETKTIAVAIKEEDLYGRKATDIRIKQELSPSRIKKEKTTPPRSTAKEKKSRRRSQSEEISKPSHRQRSKTDATSPPRKEKFSSTHGKKNEDVLRNRSHRKETSDLYPTRRQRKSRFSDRSPVEQQRRQQPSDQSPRRRENRSRSPLTKRRSSDHSPDQSPPRNINRPCDQLPPQRNHNRNSSPVRKRRDSDQSPPRRRRESPDQSPVRKARGYHRDSPPSDQSPPRRRKESPDQSPLRKARENRKDSPPSKQCASDQSPPRRRRESPDRKARANRKDSPPSTHLRKEIKIESPSPPQVPRKSRWERDSDSPPPTHKPKTAKTLDGKTAGLQNAKALKAETSERRRNEELLFDKMSSEVSGRNAEVKVRSTGRQGRRAKEAREEDPEERRLREERERRKNEEYERLGKGIKQLEDYKKRKAEMEHESNKPLARYSNDDDLERHLKEKERAEDPMLEYMRKKRKETEKASGKPQKPEYQGSYPENRFGIRPGYRWDGLDRSNGYEKRWFDVQNAKKATQDEAYKYSVEDM